jgi:hypothetical protein
LDLRAAFGIAIEHDYGCAFFQKAGGSRGADSARASGDQDALVLESSHRDSLVNGGSG